VNNIHIFVGGPKQFHEKAGHLPTIGLFTLQPDYPARISPQTFTLNVTFPFSQTLFFSCISGRGRSFNYGIGLTPEVSGDDS